MKQVKDVCKGGKGAVFFEEIEVLESNIFFGKREHMYLFIYLNLGLKLRAHVLFAAHFYHLSTQRHSRYHPPLSL